jgi:hypothetical protein
VLALSGFVARFFFVVADLPANETPSDRTKRDCSCEPKAKARHCD